MQSIRLRLVLVVACLCCWSTRAEVTVTATNSVIISGHPEATKLGMAVLKRGGNAIDALVTVSLALNVTEPGNSGLGGKFTMLYYDAATQKVTAVMALEAAPLATNPKHLRAVDRSHGWPAACIPGLAAALGESHRKWGTKPWNDLVTPVADLAERGYKLSPLAAEMMAEFPHTWDNEAARIYAPNHTMPKAGDVMRNPDLSHTLRDISTHGANAFYTGQIAQRLVTTANEFGEPWTMEDFAAYKPRFLEPLSTNYRGHMVYSGPPPLTGGATVIGVLKCLDQRPWPEGSAARNATEIDTICRVLQQVYPVSSKTAGDVPDSYQQVQDAFAPDHIRELVDRARLADPAQPFVGLKTEPSASAAGYHGHLDERFLDDMDQASTTHLIIIDAMGNMISATQSLGLHFGAAVVAPGTGFLLNDAMNNLSYENPTGVNYVGPGKWPRSTMAPTLVFKDNKPEMAIGAPGGQRIPTGVLQVLLDVVDFNDPLKHAIAAPRFHLRRAGANGQMANIIDIDHSMDADIEAELKKRGWEPTRRPNGEFYFGAVNAAVFRSDGTILGVADQRRTSDAGGN